MPSIRVSPVKCTTDEESESTKPLNDEDTQCLIAIRAVLEMHGKQDRFGVALLPQGLASDGNEVLLVKEDKPSLTRQAACHTTGGRAGTVWKLNEAASRTLNSRRPKIFEDSKTGHYPDE